MAGMAVELRRAITELEQEKDALLRWLPIVRRRIEEDLADLQQNEQRAGYRDRPRSGELAQAVAASDCGAPTRVHPA